MGSTSRSARLSRLAESNPALVPSVNSSYDMRMIRFLSMRRSFIAVVMLALAIASVSVPLRANAPATPTASGCSSPPIGGLMAVFDTCEECEYFGAEGASQGQWYSWHCRALFPGYGLYAT
jgi:hypothetical protein